MSHPNFLIPLFLIGVGLWQLLSGGEGAWASHERRMRARGIVNLERTPEWDKTRTVGGGLLVAMGVAMFLLFLALGNSSNGSRSQRFPQASGQWFDEKGTPLPPEEARALDQALKNQNK